MTSNFKTIANNKQQNEFALDDLQNLPKGKDVSIEQMKKIFYSSKNQASDPNMTIDEFVQEFSKKISDMKIFEDQHISASKAFSDIAVSGPKNMGEVALLEAACTLLSPDELMNAIVGKKSVSDVATMIDQSQTKKQTTEIIVTRQTQLQEELQRKTQLQQEVKSIWREKVSTQEANKSELPSVPNRDKSNTPRL